MRKFFRHHLTVMAFISMSLVSSSFAGEPSNNSGIRRLNLTCAISARLSEHEGPLPHPAGDRAQ